MRVYLQCRPTRAVDNGLIRWHLMLINGDRPVDRVNVYSGAPGCQQLNSGASDYPGSGRPIPPGRYRLGPVEVASVSWGQSIGKYWIDLIPFPETKTYGRRDFGIHLDANYYQPGGRGSAGCIVTPNERDMMRIVNWLKAKASPEYLEVTHLYAESQNLRYTISNVRRAWLDLIAWCEGTDGPNGYRMMFTGKLFSSFADHPRQIQRSGSLASDAAGRYQFLSTTWDECRAALQLPDFSPASQDQAALYLIDRRGALKAIDEVAIAPALDALSWEWASLPDSKGNGRYGQPCKSVAQINQKLRQLLKG